MKKRDVVKAVVEISVSAGVSILARDAIRLVAPQDLNKPQIVLAKIGAFALTGLVASAASGYVADIVDKFADGVDAGRAEAARHIQDKKAEQQAEADIAALREKLSKPSNEEDESDGR